MFTAYLQPNVEIPKKWEFYVNDIPYDDPETHQWEIRDVVEIIANYLDPEELYIYVRLNGKKTRMDGLIVKSTDIIRIVA